MQFLDALDAPPRVEVRQVAPRYELEALGRLRRHDERMYSFVDATSFAVIRALRLTQALDVWSVPPSAGAAASRTTAVRTCSSRPTRFSWPRGQYSYGRCCRAQRGPGGPGQPVVAGQQGALSVSASAAYDAS